MSDNRCDIACVLVLAGGVHRSLAPGTKVFVSGMSIHNRLAPNVSHERREDLTARFGEQFRIYPRDMGFDPALFDNVAKNSETRRHTEIPPSEWIRLHIITGSSL